MTKARIMRFGITQAVRLPRQFHFQGKSVDIFRRRNEVVVREPGRNLGNAFNALATMPRDSLSESRKDTAPQKRG
jgi:antitoxin VapB